MTPLDRIIKFSAHPDEAQNHFDQFLLHHKKFDSTNNNHLNFVRIFGNSRFLTNFISHQTNTFDQYLESSKRISPKNLSELITELKQINLDQDAYSLHRYKYNAYIQFTINELLGLNHAETYNELSDLAQAVLTVTTQKTLTELASKNGITANQICPFAILGMGKFGGRELNYSSDIDLIGFYDVDADWGPISAHEFFVKLFTQIGSFLTKSSEHGFLFRVDWDLRPEGKSGTLSNSFTSMESYYTTFGAEWERQAYIKARPVFQTNNIGDEFLSLMSPFIYRKAFDEKTIKNTWDMKHRIVTELNQKPSRGTNIKLDHGGIRDVEFFAQGFQLLYGGSKNIFRVRNTLAALDALAKTNLVPHDKIQTLKSGYLFLRRLESCLQMEDEQQTHVYLDDPKFKLKQARRMGIDISDNEAIGLLDEQIYTTRTAIKTIFAEYYNLS